MKLQLKVEKHILKIEFDENRYRYLNCPRDRIIFHAFKWILFYINIFSRKGSSLLLLRDIEEEKVMKGLKNILLLFRLAMDFS